jgi:hypothetical protein
MIVSIICIMADKRDSYGEIVSIYLSYFLIFVIPLFAFTIMIIQIKMQDKLDEGMIKHRLEEIIEDINP